jgi:glycosyltransferase involved in cell wall biosynthesis
MSERKEKKADEMTGDQSPLSGASACAVSVIMPAFRVAEYIAEALDSVLAQRFDDYEIIVVNDGSPDTEELERVLAGYQPHIVYLKQQNRGLSGARNTAIRAARGEFIALLDPDDMWEPDYLAVHVAAMRNDPTIDVYYSNAIIFGDGADVGRELMDVCPTAGEVSFESVIMQECNVLICATVRREAILRAGLFDEALRSSEDFDLWLRILKTGGRVSYHRQPLARYRRRRGSLSSDPVWMCEHYLQVLDKVERTMTLTRSELETVQRRSAHMRATLNLHEGKRAFFSGDALAAIEKLNTANAYLNNRKLALTLWLMRFAPRLLMSIYKARDRFILRTNTRY